MKRLLLLMALAACGKHASTPVPESGSGSGSGSDSGSTGGGSSLAAQNPETPAGDEPPALVMTVQGDIAGTTPELMDTLFVVPMLGALAGMPHVASSIARTTAGRSDIVLRFEPGTDADAAKTELQARIDDPALHEKMPTVDHAGWVWGDPANPSAVMLVTGGDTVRDDAGGVGYLLSRLADVPNLDRVMLRGPRQAVVVRVDLAKAAASGLTIASITTTMQAAPRPESPDDLAALILTEKSGVGVTLKDVAAIEQGLDPYATPGEKPGIAIWVHPGQPRDPVIAAVHDLATQALPPGMRLGARVVAKRMPLLLAVATDAKSEDEAGRGAHAIELALKTSGAIVDAGVVPSDAPVRIAYEPDGEKLTALKVDPVAFRRVRRTFSGEQIVALTDGTPVIFAPPDRLDAVTVETEGGPLVIVAAFAALRTSPQQVVRVGRELGALLQLEPATGKSLADLQAAVAHEASVHALHAVVLQP